MKNAFIYIVKSLLILFIFDTALAQSPMPKLTIRRPEDIRIYISKFYNPGDKFKLNACVNVVVYAKFKITKKGKIDSLDISTTGPSEIREAFKKAILTTDGLWKMTAGEKKQINGNTYLLPLICYYEAGCHPGILDSLPINNRKELLIGDKKFYFKAPQKIIANEILNQSLFNMLGFEKGIYQTLNCIIINPVVFGSMQ
jgi:hypothetical protein